jgi:hypothetical protein
MSSSLSRLCALLLTLAGLGVTGCSNTSDYAVVISWAVNGFAPTQEVCDFHGIKSVRLTIPDGAEKRTVEGRCADTLTLSDGYDYGGFVTTEWFEFGAVYSYQLQMIATNGDIIIADSGTFRAEYNDYTPVELATLNFFAPRQPGGEIASVTGSYSFAGTPDLAQACNDKRVNRVELWVYSVLDFDYQFPDRALFNECPVGTLDSGPPLLNPGDYLISYVALDYTSEASFQVVQELDPIPVVVDQAGTVELPHAEFSIP